MSTTKPVSIRTLQKRIKELQEENAVLQEHLFNLSNTEQVAPPTAVGGIDSVLQERGSRYGNFTSHAVITQGIKRIMHGEGWQHAATNWESLTCSQQECLEMVAHKIGRILNGDPDYVDSWTDIIGYVRLVERELQGDLV